MNIFYEAHLTGLIVFSGPLGWVFSAIWGALWGSFFNVMIARLPAGQSLVRPGSHCLHCQTPVRWYDNIPIFSYLLLRGRCRHCGTHYSARYLGVEVLVAMLSVTMFAVHVHAGDAPLALRFAQFIIASLFAGLLVAISFIDLATMRIPDAITYPGIVCCVLLSPFFQPLNWWDGLAGALGGYLLIRLFADGYYWLTGRLGMGYGDAKLLAMIGGLLGWQFVLPALFLASFQGSIIGISVLLWMRRRARNTASPANDNDDPAATPPLRLVQIPFGPYLALAALELLAARHLIAPFFPFL